MYASSLFAANLFVNKNSVDVIQPRFCKDQTFNYALMLNVIGLYNM